MTTLSLEINLGHILTIASIVLSFYGIHRGRKRDAHDLAEGVAARARELAAAVQIRHEENVKALAELKAKIETLDHLDECMDKLRNQIYDWIMERR